MWQVVLFHLKNYNYERLFVCNYNICGILHTAGVGYNILAATKTIGGEITPLIVFCGPVSQHQQNKICYRKYSQYQQNKFCCGNAALYC